MLQFHKAAFSLETAVNNFRTGVGRRFLQWEEGADLGSEAAGSIPPCHAFTGQPGASLSLSPVSPPLKPRERSDFAGFSLPFAHQDTNCHWIADTPIWIHTFWQ